MIYEKLVSNQQILAYLTSIICALCLISPPHSNHSKVFLYFLLNLAWVVLWKRKERLTKPFIMIFLIANLLLIFKTSPFFEADYYRYFIDGLHALEQLPIYSFSPKNSPLATQYAEVWKYSQYNEYKSIYPGMTVSYFKYLVWLSQKNIDLFALSLKVSALIFGAIISLVISNLKYSKLSLTNFILIWLHPLFILEWYINLHYDFLFALSILLLVSAKKQYIKQLVLAAGFHLKFLILLFIPFSEIQKKYCFLGLILTSLGGWLLYPSVLELNAMLRNLLVFGTQWEMNAGSFKLTRIALSPIFNQEYAIRLSYLMQCIFLIAAYLFMRLRSMDLNRHTYWPLVYLFILTSPVVNPWYFSWILPLAFLSNLRSSTKYLLFIPGLLNYMYYFSERFNTWVVVEHISMIALFIYLIIRESTSSQPSSGRKVH